MPVLAATWSWGGNPTWPAVPTSGDDLAHEVGQGGGGGRGGGLLVDGGLVLLDQIAVGVADLGHDMGVMMAPSLAKAEATMAICRGLAVGALLADGGEGQEDLGVA